MSDLYARLRAMCPRLAREEYVESSPARRRCNCFAWVAGDTTRAWYPRGEPDLSYWPPGVRDDFKIDAFIEAYATLGYTPCADGALVEGVEKIALYEDVDGAPSHAARQLPDGQWESKMGTWEDIRHRTPACLEGGDYGVVRVYLERSRRGGADSLAGKPEP
jgi:hypothetical protein